MLESFSTNATVAKVRAIYGKRLTEDDYKELMRRSSVSEVAEYLKKNTHYREMLQSIDCHSIHRGLLESLLKREIFEQYVKLCKFQQLDRIPFYNYNIVRNESELIITFILHLNGGFTSEIINEMPSYIIEHSSFDCIALAKARTYEQMLEVIRKTPYYDIVKDEKPDCRGLYDCTEIETKLRKYYVDWLLNAARKSFNKKTYNEISRLVTVQTNILNIKNAFRLKSFSVQNISQYMVPIGGKTSSRSGEMIFNAKDADEFVGIIQKSYFGRRIEHICGDFDKDNLYYDLSKVKKQYEKNAMRSTSSAAVSLFAVLFLFDMEVENIINIIEGIRYKAPTSFIEKLLII